MPRNAWASDYHLEMARRAAADAIAARKEGDPIEERYALADARLFGRAARLGRLETKRYLRTRSPL